MTNRVDGNTSYPPSQMKDYVYCDQAKQTFMWRLIRQTRSGIKMGKPRLHQISAF